MGKGILILLLFFYGQVSLAQSKYQKKIVEDSIRSLSKKEAQADAYLHFGYQYLNENITYSKILIDKALEISEKYNYKEGIAKSYLNLALYHSHTKFKNAYIYFQKAEKIANDISNPTLLVKILEQKAQYHIHFFQYDEAIACIQDAIKNIERHRLNRDAPYKIMANILLKKQDYPKAIFFYKIVIKTRKERKEEDRIPGILSEIGNVHYQLQKYDSARWYYQEGLKIAQKYKKEADFGYLYDNIGLSFYKQKRYEEALTWQKKSLTYRKKSNSDLAVVAILNNLGKTHLALKQYDSALLMAKEALPRAIKFEDLFLLQEVYEVMGDAFWGLGSADSAFVYQKKAYQYLDSLKRNQEKETVKGAAAVIEAQKEIMSNETLRIENDMLLSYGFVLFIFLLIIIGISITLFRQNKKRKKILIELQEVNQTKDKLFTILGHDLRSPIGALEGVLSLMNKGSVSQEEFQHFLPLFHKNVKNMQQTLENLLQWSISQMHGMSANPSVINLSELIDKKVGLFEAVAQAKNITLSAQIPAELTAWADPNHVRLLLRNLINNAIKFTPKDGQINITAEEKDHKIIINITDTGVGMSEEQVNKLFKKNQTFTTYGTSGEKGTGLGLQLCGEMIAKNGGNIWVRSEQKKGSTFSFSLPMVSK